ncbi:MAG: hypothetical protein HYV02_08810 [Deltaproteobacteria bacterium]|nr:hypothetical protein [Deltaproteobacteria bacterium]
MRHHKRVVVILGVAVVGFFTTALTIHWYRTPCPQRAVWSEIAFPPRAPLIALQSANAVAQWTRKYEMPCQTCHTSFPRLNAYGEKFAKNGYQIPETEDGDETKTEVSETTFIDKIGHLFGVRVSVSPVEVTTKSRNVNGSFKPQINFGAARWVQFFTAGTIFKNASIFIETEIPGDASDVAHVNWFTLGYHNLFKTSWLNLRAGKLSMMNWHAQTGRLRMVPNINVQATNTRSSQGAAAAPATEDTIRFGSPTPGVELYGYNQYFLYSLGAANGTRFVDNNQYKNFFGTLRLEIPEGAFAGSAISGWGMWGRDTTNSAAAQVRNTYYAMSGGTNVRWKDRIDFIGAYFMQKERNYDMATNARNTRHNITGQLGYLINERWFAALQYDNVWDSQNSGEEYHKISQHVSYMPRQNMRIGLTTREELRSRANGRQHELLLNVRAMF